MWQFPFYGIVSCAALFFIVIWIFDVFMHVQLQAKFEALKKQHADDRRKLEDKKRFLDEEMVAFQQRKTASLANPQQSKKKK